MHNVTSCFSCLQTPDQLFDPEDPAVKELEEWELRSPDKSLTMEVQVRFEQRRNSISSLIPHYVGCKDVFSKKKNKDCFILYSITLFFI